MSRQQKPSAQETNYEASRAAAVKPSPYEERLGRMTNEVLDWSAKGDYRERPKSIFFNFADPAEGKYRREIAANTRGMGVSAYGAGANPTVLALDKAHRDDENERDSAAAYEKDVAEGVGKAAGVAGNLAQMDNSRRMGLLSSDASLYQAELNRPKQPKWWQRMIGAAVGIGANFALPGVGGLGAAAGKGGAGMGGFGGKI